MSEMNDPECRTEYRNRFRHQIFWTGIGFYIIVVVSIGLISAILAHNIK